MSDASNTFKGQDVRWMQRLDNFKRALSQLKSGVDLMAQRDLSVLEQQGVIQAFEYTHELAWNVLKDYLTEYGGLVGLIGSRDTSREAFKRGLIENGELWMEMIKSRNLSRTKPPELQLLTIALNFSEIRP